MALHRACGRAKSCCRNLPSRERPAAGFARCPRHLMSNVGPLWGRGVQGLRMPLRVGLKGCGRYGSAAARTGVQPIATDGNRLYDRYGPGRPAYCRRSTATVPASSGCSGRPSPPRNGSGHRRRPLNSRSGPGGNLPRFSDRRSIADRYPDTRTKCFGW